MQYADFEKEETDSTYKVLLEPIRLVRVKILIAFNLVVGVVMSINVFAQLFIHGSLNTPGRDLFYYSLGLPYVFTAGFVELYYYKKKIEPPKILHNFFRIMTVLATFAVTASLLHTSNNPPLQIIFDAWIAILSIIASCLILNRWAGLSVFLLSTINLLIAVNNIGFDFIYNSDWVFASEKPIKIIVIILVTYYSITFFMLFIESGIMDKYKKKIPYIIELIQKKNNQAELKLKQSYDELSNLLSSISDIVLSGEMIKGKFSMNYMSPQSKEITGYDNSYFSPNPYLFFDCIVSSDRQKVLESFQQIGKGNISTPTHVFRFVRKDGKIIWINTIINVKHYGNRIFLYFVFRDITREKEVEILTQDLLRKSFKQSKLLTLGHVSANLAHEINQPLNYVNGVLQLLKLDSEKNKLDYSRSKEEIENSLHSIQRISGIINNLSLIAKDRDSLNFYSVKEIVDATMYLFKNSFADKNILFTYVENETIPSLYVNKNKMEQVFINLFTNASDALVEKENKEIRIVSIYSKETKKIIISFYDTGCGVEEEIRKNIFEPFFTTKTEQTGTGLGLSIISGILRDFEAKIECESVLNEYTLFTMEFPYIPQV